MKITTNTFLQIQKFTYFSKSNPTLKGRVLIFSSPSIFFFHIKKAPL